MVRQIALGLLVLGATGCADVGTFQCLSDEQCGEDAGSCEPNGYCSFAAPDCLSGRRYGALAPGTFAHRCVEDETRTEVGSSSGGLPSDLDPDATDGGDETGLDVPLDLGGGAMPRCGDGHIDPLETCDDGNTDAADGCSPMCNQVGETVAFASLSANTPVACRDLVALDDGTLVLVGTAEGPDGRLTGGVWQKRPGSDALTQELQLDALAPQAVDLQAAVLDPTGASLILGGSTHTLDGERAFVERRSLLDLPTLQWHAELTDGHATGLRDLAIDSDGALVAAGWRTAMGLPRPSVSFLRLENGNIQGVPADTALLTQGSFERLELQPDGTILVVGLGSLGASQSVPIVARLDADGQYVWEQTLEHAPADVEDVRSLAHDGTHHWLVGGTRASAPDPEDNGWLMRFSAEALSEAPMNLPPGTVDAILRPTADLTIVAGTTPNPVTPGSRATVAAFASANDPVWSWTYAGADDVSLNAIERVDSETFAACGTSGAAGEPATTLWIAQIAYR